MQISKASGLVITDFGVDFAASGDIRDPQVISEAFVNAVRAKNRSVWALGDLYNWMTDAGQDFAQLLSPTDLSLHTAQNYGSTCKTFPYNLRLIPLSQSHYAAASKLASEDMPQALELLKQAYDQEQGRDWIRDECAKLLGIYVESAEVLLVFNAERRSFDAASAPAWLADGYTVSITVRRK